MFILVPLDIPLLTLFFLEAIDTILSILPDLITSTLYIGLWRPPPSPSKNNITGKIRAVHLPAFAFVFRFYITHRLVYLYPKLWRCGLGSG